MATHTKPVVGDWYINADGQFIRAWGCVYEQGRLRAVVLQPLNGGRQCVTLSQWRALDLVRYAATADLHREIRLP